MKKMLKNITIILVAANVIQSCSQKKEVKPFADVKVEDYLFVSPKNDSRIPVDSTIAKSWKEINFEQTHIIARMAYADTANFMHEKIYPCAKCFLRPEAAIALIVANDKTIRQGHRLLIFDCYRPKVYQKKMYDLVKNPDYVALPEKGSMHNRGLAVDLALADRNGHLLEFGSEFDDFTEKAHYSFEGISKEAKENRKKLRDIMVSAGFEPYKNEWWHFSFIKVQYPVDGFTWNCN